MRHAASPFPARSARRLGWLTALSVCLLAGCGTSADERLPDLGTVSLLNQTDLGMAPLIVEAFFLAPVGETNPGNNLLATAVPPGGIVIVGLFPPGRYNAVAVLDGGGQINFPPAEVIPGQPTNFIVP